MFEYEEPTTYHLRKVQFAHLGGSYVGRGTMTWDPADGFRVDAALERHGPPLPKTLELGRFGVVPRSDFQMIKLRLTSHDWAVIPYVRVADRLELLVEGGLSFRATRALFATRGAKTNVTGRYSGTALIAAPKALLLPDRVETTTLLVDTFLSKTFRSGLLEEGETHNWRCWRTDDVYVHTSWDLSSSAWSRYDSWIWPEAVCLAVSLLSGRVVRLAERTIYRRSITLSERNIKREVCDLDFMAPFGRGAPLDRNLLVTLTPRFVRDESARRIASLVMQQLSDASRQETWQAKELLCATILEALLRTVQGHPFKPGDRSFNIEAALKHFRVKHFDDSWKCECTRALDAHRRLRHRNAHPDWIATEDGGLSSEQMEQSLDDMIRLSRLYGYMILALAGLPKMKPAFPAPHRQWGATMTMESGGDGPSDNENDS